MKILLPLITLFVSVAVFIFLSQSSVGIKTADLYWKPSASQPVIFFNDEFLLPQSRFIWLPLFLSPKTYSSPTMAVIASLPYWLALSLIPASLAFLLCRIFIKSPKKTPLPKNHFPTRALPSEKSF